MTLKSVITEGDAEAAAVLAEAEEWQKIMSQDAERGQCQGKPT